MNQDIVVQAVLAAVKEEEGRKRLSCADALRIAMDCHVLPEVIGGICDQHGIKLHTCQLGCF